MEKILSFFTKAIFVILALVVALEIWGLLGNLGFTSSCVMRYNVDPGNLDVNNDTQVKDSISLSADGSFSEFTNKDNISQVYYGKWFKSSVYVIPPTPLIVSVTGEVSMCKSYVPENNLQTDKSYPKSDSNEKIEIPRIDSSSETNMNSSQFLPLIFDVATYPDSWRNIVEVTNGDKVLLMINKNSTGSASSTNSFLNDPNHPGENPTTTCNADMNNQVGKSSPLCGRYPLQIVKGMCSFKQTSTSYPSGMVNALYSITKVTYVHILALGLQESDSFCRNFFRKDLDISPGDAKKPCPDHYSLVFTNPSDVKVRNWSTYLWMPAGDNVSLVPYAQSNERMEWPDSGASMNCSECPISNLSLKQESCSSNGRSENQIWFTANNQVGLQYRIADSNNQQFGDIKEVGKILTSDPSIPSPEPYKDSKSSPPYSIYNETVIANVSSANKQYLQLKFEDGTSAATGGGYVVGIQHTKCIRENGIGAADANSNGILRGQVRYLILNGENDPNVTDCGPGTAISEGKTSIDTTQSPPGTLWLKVDNVEADYENSYGSYNVSISYPIPSVTFLTTILNPIIKMFKDNTFEASKKMFKNITCSGVADKSNCTNYINWVHALLIIYIVIIGMQFILGMAKFNAQELFIKVTKVIIVAGLINGNTFDFFISYFYPLITGFMDEIIANIAGYSSNANSQTTAPFLFIDTLMSKIFFNKAFYAQLLSVFAMGLMGIPFFIMVVYSLTLILSSVMKVISLYLMSIMFIALLISLAPIFIVFILFDRTRYLFDNWIKFIFRYCLEPVLMIGGTIILFQLYEVYIDQVLGHSVCWKCAWPFSLPFTGTDVLGSYGIKAIFCLNWFVPWGYEANDPTLTISFYDVIVILILAQCNSYYIEFITQASGVLFSQGSVGAPSISGGAGQMTSAFNAGVSSKFENNFMAKNIRGMGEEFSDLTENFKSALKGKDQDGNKTDMKSFLSQTGEQLSTDLKPYKEFYDKPLLEKSKYLGNKALEGSKHLAGKTWDGIKSTPGAIGGGILSAPLKAVKRILPLDSFKSPFSAQEEMQHEMKRHLDKERVALSSAGIDINSVKVPSNSSKKITIKEKAKIDKKTVEGIREQEIQKRISRIRSDEASRLKNLPEFKKLSESDLRSLVDKNALKIFKSENKAIIDSLKNKK